MSNTVRTTISVPTDVKEQMDKVEGVNWSAVATRAFEAKLLEVQSEMNVKTTEEAIARLKAADEAEKNEMHQQGKKAGRRWAMQESTPKQLRKLADYEFHSPDENDWSDVVASWANQHNDGVAAGMCALLHPSMEKRLEVLVFWENLLGDSDLIEDQDFALGFIEGAIEFWRMVESRVK